MCTAPHSLHGRSFANGTRHVCEEKGDQFVPREQEKGVHSLTLWNVRDTQVSHNVQLDCSHMYGRASPHSGVALKVLKSTEKLSDPTIERILSPKTHPLATPLLVIRADT